MVERQEEKTVTNSPEETFEAGKSFVEDLEHGDVVGLEGPLGAGKTVFVKGMAEGLDISNAREKVTSPTYTLQNIYSGEKRLIHCDAYRLEESSELRNLGWEEQFRTGIGAIEWFSHLAPEIYSCLSHTVSISIEGEKKRTIRISKRDR